MGACRATVWLKEIPQANASEINFDRLAPMCFRLKPNSSCRMQELVSFLDGVMDGW
jgi:hypothetical protein